jgi:phosphatidylserine/phosphatidylglycerophosphate/cardiolipin synthase-like enzyme
MLVCSGWVLPLFCYGERGDLPNRFIVPKDVIIFPQESHIDATELLLKEIRSAKRSVCLSAYRMRGNLFIDTLLDLRRNNIKVQLIIEDRPPRYWGHDIKTENQAIMELKKAGVEVVNRPQYLAKKYPEGHYHARYIIIDGQRFIISTAHFNESETRATRDFAVVFEKKDNPSEAVLIQTLFNYDIAGKPFNMATPNSLVIGPEYQREKIIRVLDMASHSVKIYQRFTTDPKITNVLVDSIKRKKIQVKVLVSASPYPIGGTNPNAPALDRLVKAGAEVKLLSGIENHGTVVIIDDKFVLLGTGVFSPPSLDFNRELMVKIKGETVGHFLRVFDEDFEQGIYHGAVPQEAAQAG